MRLGDVINVRVGSVVGLGVVIDGKGTVDFRQSELVEVGRYEVLDILGNYYDDGPSFQKEYRKMLVEERS